MLGLGVSKAVDGPVSRYINRRISSRITSAILSSGVDVTPNQVSVISTLIGLAGAALLLARSPWLALAAGVLLQVSSIVDGVDGELARARGLASPRGAFLDAMLDRFTDVAAISAAAYYVSQHFEAGAVALLACAALCGDLLVSYVHARGEASLGVHLGRVGKVPMYASRDVRIFVLFVGCVLTPLMGHTSIAAALAAVAALGITYSAAKTVEGFVHGR